MQIRRALNRAGHRMLREQSYDSGCLSEPVLGIYEYFLCAYVQHQPAMCNFRAVILLVWRIWARYDSRRIMRISVPRWIVSVIRRVFFFRICLGDRFPRHDRVGRAGINRIPLRVHSGT